VSLGEAFIAALEGSALAEAFAHARAALLAGATIDSALDHVPVDQPDVALATHVLRLCATQGGPVSESVDRAAATLREREAVAQERVAQSAQARLSARVLTLLPIAFGGWTVLTTPTVRRFFLTPIGLICLLLGVGLNAGGWLLMRRLSRGVA
jgi:tight adherence protein B